MNEPYFALTLYNFILIVAIFFLVMIIVGFVANLGKFLQELRRLNGRELAIREIEVEDV